MRGWLCIKNFSPLGPLEQKLRALEVAPGTTAEYIVSQSPVRTSVRTRSVLVGTISLGGEVRKPKKHRRIGPLEQQVWGDRIANSPRNIYFFEKAFA